MFPAASHIMFRRRIIVAMLLTTVCAAVGIWLDYKRPSYYVHAEDRFRDVVARHGRTTPSNSDLIFLAIDSDSVALDDNLDLEGLFASSAGDPDCRHALELMSKGWPWDRELYAIILKRLTSAGAKVVGFDCLFPAPAHGDDAFRAALDLFKSRAVIGSNFVSPEGIDRSSTIPSSYDQPTKTLISDLAASDDRVGFTNFFTGEDRVVRGAQYRVIFGDRDQLRLG